MVVRAVAGQLRTNQVLNAILKASSSAIRLCKAKIVLLKAIPEVVGVHQKDCRTNCLRT